MQSVAIALSMVLTLSSIPVCFFTEAHLHRSTNIRQENGKILSRSMTQDRLQPSGQNME